MNFETERRRYLDRLEGNIKRLNGKQLYEFILEEFKSGRLDQYKAWGTLPHYTIPLKNQLGEITDRKLFICDLPEGYFPTEIIRRIIVHAECIRLAKQLSLDQLSTAHFEHFDHTVPLSDDDVESLLDDYFENGDEILQRFYWEGLLADELVNKYDLGYLTIGPSAEKAWQNISFPNEPVKNFNSLREYIKRLMSKPIEIVSVFVQRSENRGRDSSGRIFPLDKGQARMDTISRYTPPGVHKKCFCQMCGRLYSYELIEVNNIELNPSYYFSQLRVSLCLHCSKRFESLRANQKLLAEFRGAILAEKITNQGTVDIPFHDTKITFTATHLAEIQEIFRQRNQ